MARGSTGRSPRRSKHGGELSLAAARKIFASENDQDELGGNPARPCILSVSEGIIQELKAESEMRNKGACEQILSIFCRGKDGDGQEYAWDTHYWNKDIRARWIRFYLIAGLPVIMLFIMNELTDGGRGTSEHYLSKIMGVTVALTFTFYFMTLILQLGPAEIFRYLIPKFCQRYSAYCRKLASPKKRAEDAEGRYFYKIETRLSQVRDWASMRVANTQVMYKLRPIQSISEFSAISGGQANQMIANLGPFCWIGVAMMYVAHMQCDNGEEFHFDFTDVLLVVGVNGIVMIGLFELNQFDHGMVHGHYVGVLMAICLLVASMAQGISLSQTEMGQWALIVPIVLNVISWFCFFYWHWVARTSLCNAMEKEFNEWFENTFSDEEDMKRKEAEYRERHAFDEEFTSEMRDELKAEIKRERNEKGKQYIKEHELRERVHAISIKCVAYEGLAIYCTTLALAWFLFQWGNVCKIGCVHD